jgi:hypothetical protein
MRQQEELVFAFEQLNARRVAAGMTALDIPEGQPKRQRVKVRCTVGIVLSRVILGTRSSHDQEWASESAKFRIETR